MAGDVEAGSGPGVAEHTMNTVASNYRALLNIAHEHPSSIRGIPRCGLHYVPRNGH